MERAEQRMRVLVVDDDIMIRRFLLRSLRRHAEVHEAPGAIAALSNIRASAFDVVITDEHMPDGSGRALLAQVRTILPRCRRILMSAEDFVLEQGGDYDAFFPKLGGLPRLVAWVRVAAAKRRTGDIA